MHYLRFLTGQGQFTENLYRKNFLHMVVVRAPIAHGKIVSIDTDSAIAMPGVCAVMLGVDDDVASLAPLNSDAQVTQEDGSPMREPDRPVLPTDKVAFLGQPVATVIAETSRQAQDAAEAIWIEYEDLPPVLSPDFSATAAQIWPDIPENRAFHWSKGDWDKTEAAFAHADHVVRSKFVHPRMSMAPIETRSCIAEFDKDTRKFVLTTPSQGVVSLRRLLSQCLGISDDDLRVVTNDVGGSFAVKIYPYPEQVLALVAARRCGRPVRWVSSRGESLQSDAAARARVDYAELALSSDGKFLGFRNSASADMGAFLGTVAPAIVTAGSVRVLNQAYDIPAMHYRMEAMYTTQTPTDAFRGAGKPEGAATLERLIDLAARELNIDPLKLRLRNLIKPAQIPHDTAMGETIDSGDYPALAEQLIKDADWGGYDTRHMQSTKKGLLRGRAIGFHIHATGGSSAERTEVRALPDGTVRVRTGTQESGQSHRASLAKIAAEALDLPESVIVVEQGDSAFLETGGGTGGSNLLAVAGNNVHLTAGKMLDAAKDQAADHLEAARADIDYAGGTFSIIGTDRSVSLATLVSAAPDDTPACSATMDFSGNHWTFPSGGYAIEVEIDPQTGALRVDRVTCVVDLGRIINVPAAFGQIHGGVAQAIGEVFMEALIADDDGQLLTGSLMDYAMPRAGDVPLVAITTLQTESPSSVLGVKGVGELPSIGAPGVLMNAALDALSPMGVTHLDKPITSAKIWAALQS